MIGGCVSIRVLVKVIIAILCMLATAMSPCLFHLHYAGGGRLVRVAVCLTCSCASVRHLVAEAHARFPRDGQLVCKRNRDIFKFIGTM